MIGSPRALKCGAIVGRVSARARSARFQPSRRNRAAVRSQTTRATMARFPFARGVLETVRAGPLKRRTSDIGTCTAPTTGPSSGTSSSTPRRPPRRLSDCRISVDPSRDRREQGESHPAMDREDRLVVVEANRGVHGAALEEEAAEPGTSRDRRAIPTASPSRRVRAAPRGAACVRRNS